jgi:uncharacterized protein YdaU (DUF1376 family)
MSFAYLPLYTGDYLRDTRACSMAEHGAYLLFLIHCWDTREPVPLDEREAAGICNARSGDELEAMRRVLARYFVKMDDGWYNKRMQTEIERAEAISRARSDAGRKGFEAIARRLTSKRPARARQQLLSPSPYHTNLEPEKSEALASSSASQTLSADATPPVELIPLNDGTDFCVTAQQVSEWERLYPAVDVVQTLREIRGWNLAEPRRRKTRSGVVRHITSWLAREQPARSYPREPDPAVFIWLDQNGLAREPDEDREAYIERLRTYCREKVRAFVRSGLTRRR